MPVVLGLLLLSSCANPGRDHKTSAEQVMSREWPAYGGNKAGNRYSPLDQINTGNVQQLEVAWTYTTGDNSNLEANQRPREIQCQPIMVNGILYGTTPRLRAFALNAATGEELWSFDPFREKEPKLHSNRGVLYWENGEDKRILYSAGPILYALNALTGEPVADFGTNGQVSLHVGLGEKLGRDVTNLSVNATTPGVIYKDILILGSSVSEFGDAAPGYIRGFDIPTGQLKWVFHTVPHPGEAGYETWPAEAYKSVGGANAWAGMVVDEKRGVVYTGTGSASFDFYGGNRHGQNLFANCVLALKAETGERVWHFQTVHHDLWDKDLPCPPNLLTVTHNGKRIDAVAQSTKDGVVFLLDRDTGTPLFPVEERPVPTADALPGEQPWPTQPFPLKPAPFVRQAYTEADIPDYTPEAHAFVKDLYNKSRSGTNFLPPSLQGTLLLGIGGGAEWGGNASDPEEGILYQNANEMPWDFKMMDLATKNQEIASRSQSLYLANCAACHGADRKGDGKNYPSLVQIEKRLSKEDIQTVMKAGRGRMPSFQHLPEGQRNAITNFLMSQEQPKLTASTVHGPAPVTVEAPTSDFPYQPPFVNNGWIRLLDPAGYPGIKPPWGTLNAIDLNTGEYLWRVPLGEHKELTEKGVPQTGTINYGGPIATAGGLLFIGATMDEKFRAFDKKTGKVLWEFQLPAAGFATPCTYEVNGKQYVVIAAGGVKLDMKTGDSFIAFALP
jgi:quinoprotein glucose dehydrogenase